MQQELHRIVREATAEGRTVFLSSHVLSEAERMPDRVGIIRYGRLVDLQRSARSRPTPCAASSSTSPGRCRPRSSSGCRRGRGGDAGGGRRLVAGRVILCAVEGSVDVLIKAAAGYELVNVDPGDIGPGVVDGVGGHLDRGPRVAK